MKARTSGIDRLAQYVGRKDKNSKCLEFRKAINAIRKSNKTQQSHGWFAQSTYESEVEIALQSHVSVHDSLSFVDLNREKRKNLEEILGKMPLHDRIHSMQIRKSIVTSRAFRR